ncbi:DedA family protein [Algoriphagus lacus]|uniref:TVP38/TMEM64 family membrane protein n=1 Tax=Algoriphagus lacus TaxID=2056311 RepID=A0A418PQS5_9BACT|nr:VTT domain-containing protein [Algoriphagus lacus]RIW14963.1 DedA family protein [Algoriphagus lacus]
MKALLKITLVLSLAFASTFLIIRLSGVLTEDDIKTWLEAATTINPWYVGLAVVSLLAVDLFIAVPTLTICILSGYLLGFPWGGLSASIGLLSAGLIGYWLSRAFGESILQIIVRSEEKREDAKAHFVQYGLSMILLSRSSPIFPEVCACVAGMTGMKFSKFYLAWTLNSIPYALIAAYSGSISDFENPKPAIYTMIGLYLVIWLAWFIYRKRN